MKIRHCVIACLLVLAAMVACTSNVETRHGTSLPADVSPELAAIDSLMWRQPDSALQCLLACRDAMLASPNTPDGDTMETHAMRLYNEHYYQLLLAELLYKNYQPQTNRDELLRAVAYFDSLTLTLNDNPTPWNRHCGLDPQSPNLCDDIFFLDARVHYINGAGYYENDSVVEACAEYLKTLEMMEEQFEEKELTGKKAQFMANIYNRLGNLFSEQFMMESSISCYEKALIYCIIEPTSPNGISSILYRIGKQYDKKNEIEKARLYYSQALENVTVTDNMVYRDIVASKALCDYQINGIAKQSLDELNRVLFQAKTEKERLNRKLTIGCIYFYEDNYDSALYYLEPVFENREAGLQDQVANYLYIICNKQGDRDQADSLMHFLASRKKSDGDNKALVSELEDMFKNYSNQKLEKQAEAERKIAEKRVMNTVIPIAIAVALAIFCVLIWRNRRQLKHQQEKADRAFGEAKLKHEKELRLRQVEADKTLEETKKKYEGELRQLRVETDQQLEEVERKHQQWMAEAKERHEEELKAQKDLSEKEIEKTKKRHAEELEAERLAYQAEMAEKEAMAQTERRLHEEALKRHQVETEQRMTAAERKHQQKLKEIARKHELEMQAQQDKTKEEAEQTRKRHASELEAERMAYQKEQEALRQNLRQREEQVNALETALVQQHEEAERRREAFLKEPICQRILSQVRKKPITTRENAFELGLALKDEDFEQLGAAVEKHYSGFDHVLLSHCPSLKQGLLSLCHLHLLGINEREIAVLKNVSYSAIKKQNESLREKLEVNEDIGSYVLRVAERVCGTQNMDQNVSENNPLQQNTEEIPQESTLKSTLKGTQKTIVEIIIGNPNVTIVEIANELDLNPRGIAKHFKMLQDKGVIRRVGPDKGGHWEVIR
ncbi:MAG: winged helix-turn-helix transcriptional regulator [Bacteroidales bacterium]|nr:winged helix-turn-helix transcriptional regulator [Bacteroidales bacterium]